jgi:hypothetical protein
MIGSLLRWFGRGRSGRGTGSPRRITPQLEVLEDRAVPGAVLGGVVTGSFSVALLGAKVGGPSHVIPHGSTPAGAGQSILPGFEIEISRSSGEEIPQTV